MIHAFVCFGIAAIVGALVAHIPPHNEWITTVVAFSVALIAGLWKEVRDCKQKGNHFCVWDLLADIAGAVLGSDIAWLAAHIHFDVPRQFWRGTFVCH